MVGEKGEEWGYRKTEYPIMAMMAVMVGKTIQLNQHPQPLLAPYINNTSIRLKDR